MNTRKAAGYSNSLGKERSSQDKTKNDKRNEIRLEFVQIDVQGASKAKRNGDRRNDLSDQSIQVGETRLGNPEVLFADSKDRFVVNLKRMAHYGGLACQQSHYHEGTVSMF
jgi:hypothetical protein